MKSLSRTPSEPSDRSFMESAISNRRSAPRAKISLHIRVRSFDSKYPGDICTTLNISRDGLYFVTSAGHHLEHYFRNVKVHVMRNFRPNDPANQEEIGDVVRIDGPKDGKWGVAIRISLASGAGSKAVRNRSVNTPIGLITFGRGNLAVPVFRNQVFWSIRRRCYSGCGDQESLLPLRSR